MTRAMASPSPKSSPLEATGFGPITRLKIKLVSLLGYWAIRLIGRTLRWQVEGEEHLQSLYAAKKNVIYTFWHGRIFLGTYFFRNRGIVVMSGYNKDARTMARVIERFGYGIARGSSTRGAKRAVVTMLHEIRRNKDVAFSIDGPRGPRYVAKPGAVWVASKTGAAIFPFHMSPEKKWVINSWDQFHIPKPFSRVLVLMGAPIFVKENADEADLNQSQQILQHSLEDMLHRGDAYWMKQPPGTNGS
jgi:lysophospholipid acyltransferase (LPLAT)-like uncharacterized protein